MTTLNLNFTFILDIFIKIDFCLLYFITTIFYLNFSLNIPSIMVTNIIIIIIIIVIAL
jgi:hypothetical protein